MINNKVNYGRKANTTKTSIENGIATKIADSEKKEISKQPITDQQNIHPKTKFRQNFENGMTVAEARKDMTAHIKQLYANNH